MATPIGGPQPIKPPSFSQEDRWYDKAIQEIEATLNQGILPTKEIDNFIANLKQHANEFQPDTLRLALEDLDDIKKPFLPSHNIGLIVKKFQQLSRDLHAGQ